MSQATEQRCEGHLCPVRESCQRHVSDTPDRYLPADYSLVPQFKAANARESCRMFVAAKVAYLQN